MRHVMLKSDQLMTVHTILKKKSKTGVKKDFHTTVCEQGS